LTKKPKNETCPIIGRIPDGSQKKLQKNKKVKKSPKYRTLLQNPFFACLLKYVCGIDTNGTRTPFREQYRIIGQFLQVTFLTKNGE